MKDQILCPFGLPYGTVSLLQKIVDRCLLNTMFRGGTSFMNPEAEDPTRRFCSATLGSFYFSFSFSPFGSCGGGNCVFVSGHVCAHPCVADSMREHFCRSFIQDKETPKCLVQDYKENILLQQFTIVNIMCHLNFPL